MNRKIRYSIIAFGFVSFLILAPLIVLYVRGLNFDFTSHEFVQTGILAIRAEPKDAKVLLDGKLASETAKDLKFLLPKEYEVRLEKNNYQPWQKRLTVLGGQVTWASPPSGKIFLFLSQATTSPVAENVLDFFLSSNNQLGFLTPNNFVLSSLNNPGNSETIALPKNVDSLITSTDYQKAIAQSSGDAPKNVLEINIKTKQIADLSGLFTGSAKWMFDGDNNLYALNENNLYSINAEVLSKKIIQTNVTAATFLGKDLYFLKQKTGSLSLQILTGNNKDGQDILTGLPLFASVDIFINYEKQVYIVGDSALYKVGSSLETLAKDLSSWNFYSNDSSLVFFHNGELGYVNPSNHTAELITRRGSKLDSPLLRFAMSNCFFLENGIIKTTELDTRDRQNQYDLYTGQNIKKFALDGDGKNLLVLDGNTLKIVTIR